MTLIFRGVLLLAIVIGLIALVRDEFLPALRSAPSAAAVALATPTSISGTLTYYPNNLGTEVPYIVYKTPSGATATKALGFTSDSTCETAGGSYPCPLIANALSSYYGATVVRAEGVIDAANIEITTLAPA